MQFVDAVYSSGKRTEFKRTPRDVRITSERVITTTGKVTREREREREREEGEERRAKR